MNASIESARAGDAGRGFAIVAGEVRNLSISTNQTSKQISEMLQKMNNTVGDVLEKIEQIHDSVTVQSTTMEEINATVEELNTLPSNVIPPVITAAIIVSISVSSFIFQKISPLS